MQLTVEFNTIEELKKKLADLAEGLGGAPKIPKAPKVKPEPKVKAEDKIEAPEVKAEPKAEPKAKLPPVPEDTWYEDNEAFVNWFKKRAGQDKIMQLMNEALVKSDGTRVVLSSLDPAARKELLEKCDA